MEIFVEESDFLGLKIVVVEVDFFGFVIVLLEIPCLCAWSVLWTLNVEQLKFMFDSDDGC